MVHYKRITIYDNSRSSISSSTPTQPQMTSTYRTSRYDNNTSLNNNNNRNNNSYYDKNMRVRRFGEDTFSENVNTYLNKESRSQSMNTINKNDNRTTFKIQAIPLNIDSNSENKTFSVYNNNNDRNDTSNKRSKSPTMLIDLVITTPRSDIKIQRKCKSYELIFNSDYTKNINQNYHMDHFTCWHCDQSLTGSRYILKDEHPYCIRCYEELFAHTCEECKRKIGTDSKDLSYKDRHWHEKCFFCSVCKIPLIDKPFGSKNDALFCGECYNQKFASRCDKCGQIFKPGMKKMEYKGQQFHENCFVCFTCSNPIGTKSFIPKESRIYCVPCYEDQFATKCTRCIKVISQGGVTYKNQPFHRECFTCTNCHQSLAGQRFTSRDDHPYCSDCFGKLFAKKCYACTKPITGIGGTKYISFEDRHWHNDCFTCNKCQTSLVGRGFLTEGSDIYCPDCGRN